MCCRTKWLAGSGLLLVGLLAAGAWWAASDRWPGRALAAADEAASQKDKGNLDKIHPMKEGEIDDHETQLPDLSRMTPFAEQSPITFVNRGQAEWASLKGFWNEADEKAFDPQTGKEIVRKAVRIRVPLGLTSNPPVPAENPMTVEKWMLGKQLYFDPILSSDGTISCATCHDPGKGFTDQSRVSVGISGKVGGISAPTIFNSAYNAQQFWDGRAASLEDQSQGPVMNALEMFGGNGHAWRDAVKRLRKDEKYVKQFQRVFGTQPTRDSVAKAIAAYERTVLSGNSIHDRAEVAMRKRVEAEETNKFVLRAADYATVLKAAYKDRDEYSLKALKLDPAKEEKIDEVAKSLVNGRNVFFDKGRCNLCHAGDNFSDNTYHNLGVGVKDGKVPASQAGRYGAMATGHKNPDFYGAFKTPTLRHLLGTGPYLHDGSEKTLEGVVELYDRGGNANAFLDVRMRDEDAEREWWLAKQQGKEYQGKVEVKVFDGKPIAPKKLNLTAQEKADLVLFLRALQGDLPDPLVGDPKKMPR